MGLQDRGAAGGAAVHGEAARVLLDADAHLGQLDGQGVQPVGLVAADHLGTGDEGRAVGQRGQRGDRGDLVGERGHVDAAGDGAQPLRSRHRHGVAVTLHVRAERLQHVEDRHVGLVVAAARVRHRHPATRGSRQRIEVRGGRRVGRDHHHPGTVGAWRHNPAVVEPARLDPPLRHRPRRHLDVPERGRPVRAHRHRPVGVRRDQEHRAGELAGPGDVDGHRAAREAASAQCHRREPGVVRHIGAQRPQRLGQRPDGPAAQRRQPVDGHRPRRQRRERRPEPHRGPRQPALQRLQRHLQPATRALDHPVRPVVADARPQRPDQVAHGARVVGVQRPPQPALPRRQRRQHQQPVRHALATQAPAPPRSGVRPPAPPRGRASPATPGGRCGAGGRRGGTRGAARSGCARCGPWRGHGRTGGCRCRPRCRARARRSSGRR